MRTSPFAVLQSLFALSDEEAMRRVQAHGDATAFAQLMRRWQKPIQDLCARMTGDAHCAEDLAQDVFARIFARRTEYQSTAKFSTWLWRIALNRCYDELRRRRSRGEFSIEDEHMGEEAGLVDLLAAPEAPPDGAAAQQEHAILVRTALFRLSEPYRTVVILRHYEDLKFREIAAVLEIPEGTVKSRMAEAMTQLGRMLEPSLGNAGEVRAPSRLDKTIQSSIS